MATAYPHRSRLQNAAHECGLQNQTYIISNEQSTLFRSAYEEMSPNFASGELDMLHNQARSQTSIAATLKDEREDDI